MSEPLDQSSAKLIPIRVENLDPTNDWLETWRLARISGLASDLNSFLFKMIHCLLPTQDRVQRLGVAVGGQPGLCKLCHQDVEDTLHALFSCQQSQVAGHALLGYAQKASPNLSPKESLKLHIGHNLQKEEELAVVCLLATGWLYIWQARLEKKQVCLFRMRAELEAMISVLRTSRHGKTGEIMLEMIS
jgi:hypothetical protein